MSNEYINITEENLYNEHLCCIIRTKTFNPGIDLKRKWLKERIKEGHVFRKLNVKGVVFIEYAPLEKAWVPIVGDNYYYIYCLWTTDEYRGKGYGKELLDYCINDAKANSKSGICMLGAKKQKAWLSSQEFFIHQGFKVCDETPNDYCLFALSFDGTYPRFTDKSKSLEIANKNTIIYYDAQCPYVYQVIQDIKNKFQNEPKLELIEVNSLEMAKGLPCVFNNYAVFSNGKFVTVNVTLADKIVKLLK